MSLTYCKKLDQAMVMSGFLDRFDFILTDCDGVLWIGEEAIPGSPETIRALANMGKEIIYVTNNSSKSRTEYLEKFQRLGYPAHLENIFSTSYCAALYLQSLNFTETVYVVGNMGIIKELEEAGIRYLPCAGPDPLTKDWALYVKLLCLEPEVGAVVVGFDEHVSYPKLLKAASYLKNPECLFIASSKDEQFPSSPGSNLLIPGTGALVTAIETVSERSATSLGKPSKFMFECIKMKFPGIDPNRCLMIGDKLSTDILFGTKNELKTLLVLSGVTSVEEVKVYENSSNVEDQLLIPDFYAACLWDLGKLLKY